MSYSEGTGTREDPAGEVMYAATRKRRQNRQRQKHHTDDISELNITPMLDMMTILLVFLIKSFSTSSDNVNVANLVLPHSTTKLNTEEALQLMITEDSILVDQKVVTKLQTGGIISAEDLPDGPGGYLIRPLYDALEERSSYFKRIESNGGNAFSGKVSLVADKSAPYGLIFRVLYTCGRAEFGRFKLFVQKPP
ncbi:MAG: biopolymer transporter ExbD [Myxococcota bacterium]|nr:biopolymer transporter ExbD [Myxococcota bacterium]